MTDSGKNWEESEVYGIPGTYGDIKACTNHVKQEENNENIEREEYEKGFIYLPQTKTTFEEAKKYTEEILKIL